MNRKSGKQALPKRPRRIYQPPRLVAFGKLHSIVAAGSGTNVEGMLMISTMRRP